MREHIWVKAEIETARHTLAHLLGSIYENRRKNYATGNSGVLGNRTLGISFIPNAATKQKWGITNSDIGYPKSDFKRI